MGKALCKGVIIPLVTPLKSDGSIDLESFEKCIEYQISTGVDGLFLLGSTGEGFAFTPEQRRTILKRGVEITDGRLTVYAGIGGESTQLTLHNLRLAEDCGASCVVLTLPAYFKHSDDELLEYILTIAKSSSLPVVLYNIPQFVGQSISVAIVQELLQRVDNVIGIKDSSKDMLYFTELLFKTQRDGFAVMQGAEELLAVSLLLECRGIVPGIGNLVPELCVEMFQACMRRDVPKMRELQGSIHRVISIYQNTSWLAAVKGGLELRGLCERWVSAPYKQSIRIKP